LVRPVGWTGNFARGRPGESVEQVDRAEQFGSAQPLGRIQRTSQLGRREFAGQPNRFRGESGCDESSGRPGIGCAASVEWGCK